MLKYQYYLNNNVVLRKEHFGGIVFNKNIGNTLDVDRETFILLQLLEQNSQLFKNEISYLMKQLNYSFEISDLTRVLKKLISYKIVLYSKVIYRDRCKDKLSYDIDNTWPKNNFLSAPETVHWAATYRCNLNCPDCYARRHKDSFEEMTFNEAKSMVDKLTKAKVFQLAIGGGEALIRNDIVDIIKYAANCGLAVHITTNMDNFDRQKVQNMSSHLTALQFGIDADRLLSDTNYLKKLHLSYLIAREMQLNIGINIILTKKVLNNFDYIIRSLVEVGFRRIVLLRYKPHDNHKRWLKENIKPGEMKNFEPDMKEIISQYNNVKFRFDCALSFLQRNVSPKRAKKEGIRGCVAGERILAIGPDGSIYPCSQIIAEDAKIGNILNTDFNELINNSKRLRKYRNFRNKLVFRSSICGICKAKDHCGGCRVFSHNRKEEDIGCPEPIITDIKTCGKYGRKADLKHYFKNHSYIKVETYMERYGVGQKRAVKELKNSEWLVKSYGSDTGRKKSDYYVERDNNIVYEVQDLIGFTSGGAPFAKAEEIKEWINGDKSYPDWLKRINNIF